MRLSVRPLLAALVVAGIVAPPAGATTLRYLSIEALATRSDACIRARLVAAETGWNDDRTILVTRWTLAPIEVLAGSVPDGPLTVTRVGGSHEGLVLAYEGMPRASVGDELVVALRRLGERVHGVVGLQQGLLRVHDGLAVRELDAVADSAPIEAVPLEELRTRLRAVEGSVVGSTR